MTRGLSEDDGSRGLSTGDIAVLSLPVGVSVVTLLTLLVLAPSVLLLSLAFMAVSVVVGWLAVCLVDWVSRRV